MPGRDRKLVCMSISVNCLLTYPVCTIRGQRLKEVLQFHEFNRESSELKDWMDHQRQLVESQDLGSDYQHIQVLPPQTVRIYRRKVKLSVAVCPPEDLLFSVFVR